jgi:hypothetical protein
MPKPFLATLLSTDSPVNAESCKKEDAMESSSRDFSYIESEEERESGHIDTRRFNFECDNQDSHLGCDLGIDVAG